MKSLGLIEVRGFLGAIAVADAALKSSDVHLENAEVISGGLTTVQVVGDVSAVQTAVDSGVVVAENLGCLIAHHVIARADVQTMDILSADEISNPIFEPEDEIIEIGNHVSSELEYLRDSLMKKKVFELRKQAYQMNLETLKKSKIKYANKRLLVDSILAEIKGSE